GALPAFLSGSRMRKGSDIALLQYTSGSTGNPKGVMLTHANLLANMRALAEALDWAGRRRRKLAAALSRYGIDWRVAHAVFIRRSAGGNVAPRFSDAPGALAAGIPQTQRYDRGRAEFCLRTMRAQDF